MKKSSIFIFTLALMLLLIAPVSAVNLQENTIRHNTDTYVLRYYQRQVILNEHTGVNIDGNYEDPRNVRDPGYERLDSDFVHYNLAKYLAFDNDGYPIAWEDIIVDQTQLDAINSAIGQGIQFFIDQGSITKWGQGVDFPLTLTTPDGRVTTVTIQLNIGGDATLSRIASIALKADNVTYDLTNGPLTWETLKTLANVKGYSVSDESRTYDFLTEEVIRELQDINDAITSGTIGTFRMHAIWAGYVITEFYVTLYDSNPSIYTATYHANGGTGSYTTDKLVDGSKHLAMHVVDMGISYLDHTFVGWNTKANGTGAAYAPGKEIVINNNITLYAQWESILDASKPTNPIGTTNVKYPQTADSSKIGLWMTVFGMSIVVVGVLHFKKNRKDDYHC